MIIRINGREKEFEPGRSLAEILEVEGIEFDSGIILELNGTIMNKELEVPVNHGDKVEYLYQIAGGRPGGLG